MERGHIRAKFKVALAKMSYAVKSRIGRRILNRKGERPLVIIMVDGGLCSVITKLVLGECFKAGQRAEVKYDLSWFESYGTDTDGNPTRKLSFHELFPEIDFQKASNEEVQLYKRYFRYPNTKPYIYNKRILEIEGPLYVDGYAENWQYVHEVRDVFLPQLKFENLPLNTANRQVLSDIEASEVSVAVHVRRGDYVNLGLAGLGADYYLAAIEEILAVNPASDITVFFFSDDINWVKQSIGPEVSSRVNVRCVDVNDVNSGHFDLFLISKCDHQVSSNSSFGYWGGLLNNNTNKMVIIPENWLPTERRRPEHEGCDDAHSFPGFIKFKR